MRNEGYLKSTESDARLNNSYTQGKNTGQKLWKKVKQIIPGGNMLLSKRAEMFLPTKWPAYFLCEGMSCLDLDGREFIDMSIMGIGTNLLGYGHPGLAVSALAAEI